MRVPGRHRWGGNLLLLLLLLAGRLHGVATKVGGGSGGGSGGMMAAEEEADDEESDSAPFMVVVEVEGGVWRCAGALVSLRTAVSSAWCARGGGVQADLLWALAASTAHGQVPRLDGARRVARVATAGTTVRGQWGGALLDLAVLELEAPFGSGARARPILMATAVHECAAPAQCHVVRALWTAHRARLHIVDAALAAEKVCAPLVPYWGLTRERALCVAGPTLCRTDWGAGVVCGGKLCGVVSRSMPHDQPAPPAMPRTDPACGDVTLAQSVPRWRRFLHCAHTLRACGRGTCADLCTEHQLLDMEMLAGVPPAPPEPPPPAAPAPPGPPPAGGTTPASGPSVPTRTPQHTPPPEVPQRAGQVYEPNRPDFRDSAVTRGGLLKAGEYGDNAADYGAEEPAPYTSSEPVPTRSHEPPPSRRVPPAPRLQAPHGAPTPPPAGGSSRRPAPRAPPAPRPRAQELSLASHTHRLMSHTLIVLCTFVLQVMFLLNFVNI